MTNTLHRQGNIEELKQDYVIFATTARGITRKGSAPKLQEFMHICLTHNPINIGDSKQGNILQDDVDILGLIANQWDGSGAAAVFTDLDTLREVIGELMEADLGISMKLSFVSDNILTSNNSIIAKKTLACFIFSRRAKRWFRTVERLTPFNRAAISLSFKPW